MTKLILLLASLLIVNTVCGQEDKQFIVVRPEKVVRRVPVHMNEPLYVGIETGALEQTSTYEVTLSYPATSPAIYDVQFVTNYDTKETMTRGTGRKILNTHQFYFNIETDRPPVLNVGTKKMYMLSVTATPEGVRPITNKDKEDTKEGEDVVMTDIFLSKHKYSVPGRAFSFLGTAAIICCIIVFVGMFVLPRTSVYSSLFAYEHEKV